mgnify:CR=1 FL=1
MKRNKKLYWVAFIALVVAVGALLAFAVIYRMQHGHTIVRSDTMVMLFGLLLCLPVVLVLVGVSMIVSAKVKRKGKSVDAVMQLGEEGGLPVVATTAVSKKATAASGDDEEDAVKRRFCMLSAIDDDHAELNKKKYDNKISLKKFCDAFRNYAAGELKLYYSPTDIRRFIAGLGVTHITILQGMSGTGKTSLAYAFGRFVGNSSTVIPVQPMWKERTDLIGYYNEFTKQFNETLLLKKMYEANYGKDIYITVLDEMNIARVEYYFAEFLSLLELPNVEERNLDVVSDRWSTDPVLLNGGRIRLPANMWFVGTANNDDSTFAISDKVYDRAMVMNLDDKSEPFTPRKWGQVFITAERFEQLIAEAQKEYELTERNRARLEELDKYLIANFHITFGNRIMKQIRQYIPNFVACGGEELEALDDILAKKILRKLEMQNPVLVKNAAPGLLAYLDELFGTDKMKMCKAFVHRLERNA